MNRRPNSCRHRRRTRTLESTRTKSLGSAHILPLISDAGTRRPPQWSFFAFPILLDALAFQSDMLICRQPSHQQDLALAARLRALGSSEQLERDDSAGRAGRMSPWQRADGNRQQCYYPMHLC